MNRILISADSRYPVSRPKIKKAVDSLLREKKIASDVEVSILICGTRKAEELAQKYLHDSKPHNVLSFPYEEESVKRSLTQNSGPAFMVLGDIAVCYPIAQVEANTDNILLDVKINELVTHGLLHLMGEHHE